MSNKRVTDLVLATLMLNHFIDEAEAETLMHLSNEAWQECWESLAKHLKGYLDE